MRRRHGFTLIELLVVISLIGVLAALAVLFVPTIGEKARAAQGGQMLQQWLQQARQKAQRDQSPRGVRVLNPDANGFVLQCQFIEVPEDFAGGQISQNGANGIKNDSGVLYDDFISIGDHLEILGNGLMYRITGVAGNQLTLANNLDYSFQPTTHYRILREPRVTNDELLQLPDRVGIDVNTNGAFGNAFPPPPPGGVGKVDILFSPSGQVITAGAVNETINLWVRTMDAANAFEGDPSIIAVHVRSGLVAAHPPGSPPPLDPYQYVKEGRSSK